METLLRSLNTQNWITLLLLGCLIALTIVKYLYEPQFVEVLKLRGTDTFISTSSKGSSLFHVLPLVLFLIYGVTISLLFYFVYCDWKNMAIKDNFIVYSYILYGYLAFEITKIVLERIAAYLLDTSKETRSYLYKKTLIKTWIGIFLLCGCFVVLYSYQGTSLAALTLIGFAVLIYTIYTIWLLSSYSEQISRFPFYFMLYFCTLEMSPYFILYKYVTVL